MWKLCQVWLLKPFFHPGKCEISQCSDPATCVLSQRRTCKCAVGYFGDLCDQVAKMNVTCGKDFISILVDEEFFKYYNVAVEAVNLTNASCRVHREEISGSSYFTVHTPMDQYTACGGKPLEKNITHIAYSLTLMSDPPVYGNIVRDPVVQIEYKCIYPYIRRLSLVDEVDAMVEMSLYKDHTYTEAFTSAPTIKLGDQIYVQIQVTEPEDFFHLRGSTVRYSFDVFRFECKTVSKREVVMDQQAQGLLSYGPIRRELPVRPMINTMLFIMFYPYGLIWTLGIFLFILISISKAGN
uniref:Matrix metallopeptidase 15a n=1 Tax=Sinocyclocheilus rhinocerous TaxID=307959 RepID=A0A673HXF9_9TELE